MDPITAIGLLASLCSLIEASNSLRKVIKSFKDGEKEIHGLSSDVFIFEEALKGFDRVLRSRQVVHNISGNVIERALQEGLGTIQSLEKRLMQIAKFDVPTMRRMKWVQHKPNLKKLHERLKEQSTMLQGFLALAHAETFLAVCSQHPQFLQLSSTTMDEERSDGISLQYSAQSETSTIASGSSTSSLRRISLDTTASSIDSAASSLRSFPSNTSSTSPLLSAGEFDVLNEEDEAVDSNGWLVEASKIRRSCRYDCFCICHVSSAVDPNKKIPRMRRFKPQCSEPGCQSVGLADDNAKISSFFRKAISEVISSRTIKVRYHLNTYRMVSEGSDALRYVKHGNLEKLKMCIQTNEATIWDTAPDGWSLLHLAAYHRELPIVRYLLELGADVEVADIGSRKPADLAILKSFAVGATHLEQEIVDVFAQKDDYVSDFEFTPIHIAVLNIYDPSDSDRPTLECLIEFIDDANNAPAGTDWAKWKMRYRKRSPLFGQVIELFRASAVKQPKTQKIIHNLLDQKDRKYCWTPLHWACSAGRIEKMKILMDHGADPFILSNLDANILHAAVESKTLDGLAGALEIWKRNPHQLNINQVNRWAETPLHMAARESVGCVKLLLEAGADPNILQEDGQVALHSAGLSARGTIRREIVALLCGGTGGTGSGPHINAQDIDGRPPIFDFLDDPTCLETLITHGAQLDLLDTSGKNIFHHACIQNETASLKTLLRLSAPENFRKYLHLITVKDHDGNTPLLVALRHGSLESTRIILALEDDNGDDVDIGDMVGQDGWTAAHHAARLGNAHVLEAVLTHQSFVRGMKTLDGKSVEVVAMEAGTWCGEVRGLVRRHNCNNNNDNDDFRV